MPSLFSLNSLLLVLFVILVATLVPQYQHYAKVRESIGDQQSVYHSSDTLHTVTLIKLQPKGSVSRAVSGLKGVEEEKGGKLIYAGMAVHTLIQTEQLQGIEWDLVLLTQWPSRDAYQTAEASQERENVLSTFQYSYTIGMRRSRSLMGLWPAISMFFRWIAPIRGPALPFKPATEHTPTQKAKIAEIGGGVKKGCKRVRCGDSGMTVLNLMLEHEDAEKVSANRDYGLSMLGMFGEASAGPLHYGAAEHLTEEGARYHTVAFVYYPSAAFFTEMIHSEHMAKVGAGKSLRDTLALATIPLII